MLLVVCCLFFVVCGLLFVVCGSLVLFVAVCCVLCGVAICVAF